MERLTLLLFLVNVGLLVVTAFYCRASWRARRRLREEITALEEEKPGPAKLTPERLWGWVHDYEGWESKTSREYAVVQLRKAFKVLCDKQ